MAKKDIDAIRSELAKAQQQQDEAYNRYKSAEKVTKAKGRELVSALAGDLDLTASERRAMGLRRSS